MLGTMAHTMAAWRKLQAYPGGHQLTADTDAVIRHLVGFVVGGMRAPLAARDARGSS